jgi:hypothetical protein
MDINQFHEDATGYLAMLPFVIFAFSFIGLSMIAMFKTLNLGLGTRTGNAADGDLEFFFTRAVSRRSLFYSRASRYLLASLLPFLIILAFSCARPLTRVRLSYVAQQQADMERYYLGHYHDAFLQRYPADELGNKRIDVVLPRGHVHQSFLAVAFVCATALLYQLITFAFWGKRLAMRGLFFGLMLLPIAFLHWLMPSHTSSSIFDIFTPTFYETALAWVTLHTALTLLILGLMAIVTQAYCCRRYINTEIIP